MRNGGTTLSYCFINQHERESPTNTGDGIKAALWVGAAMDPTHAMMVFDRGVVLPGKKSVLPGRADFCNWAVSPSYA